MFTVRLAVVGFISKGGRERHPEDSIFIWKWYNYYVTNREGMRWRANSRRKSTLGYKTDEFVEWSAQKKMQEQRNADVSRRTGAERKKDSLQKDIKGKQGMLSQSFRVFFSRIPKNIFQTSEPESRDRDPLTHWDIRLRLALISSWSSSSLYSVSGLHSILNDQKTDFLGL